MFTPATDPNDVRRDQCLDLADVADDGQLFLVVGRLGEHAEVEQGASAARIVDDDERVVQDVGCAVVVLLVEVIDVLARPMP